MAEGTGMTHEFTFRAGGTKEQKEATQRVLDKYNAELLHEPIGVWKKIFAQFEPKEEARIK